MRIEEWKPKRPKSLIEKILIIATILGGIAAIGYFADKLFFPTASKEELKKLEKKVGEMADYLDGLPQTKNPDLKRLFEKGYSLYKDEKYPEAIDTLKACLELKTEDSEREALLILMGNAFSILGKLKDAEDHYQEALCIGRRINDEQGKATVLSNIGLIYRAKGDLDQALKYHQEALEIDREIGFREGEAQDLIAIGLALAAKGNLDVALTHYESAIKIHKEIGFKEGETIALINIGLIYKAKGDLNQALKYYQEALEIDK